MESLFARVGIKAYSIGSPPTEVVARRNRAIAWSLFAAMTCIFMISLITMYHIHDSTDLTVQYFGIYLNWIFVLASMLGLGVLSFSGIERFTSMATIWNIDCPTLMKWASVYPEVKEHISSINAQGRPIIDGDFVFLAAWVHKQEDVERAEQRRIACQSLHGMGAK